MAAPRALLRGVAGEVAGVSRALWKETRARAPGAARFVLRLATDALRPPQAASATITVVTDDVSFGVLRPEWDRLHAASGARSAFAAFPWAHAWWMEVGRPAGHALRLYVAREGERVVGIAPLYLALGRAQILRTLGDTWVGSEHLDLLATPEHDSSIGAAIAGAIAADAQVDGAHLLDLVEDSALERALGNVVPGLVGVAAESWQTLPYLALPGDAASWEASLSSNMRYNIKRKHKKLEKTYPAVRVRVVDREDALPEALDLLFRLHARRWQSKGETGNFVRPEVRAFHRRAAPRLLERKALRLYQLDVGEGRIAATLYCLRSGNREQYLQAGFDPAFEDVSAGFCLMHRVIAGAADDGMTEFDFLRGTESYKTHWASDSRTTRQIRFARRSARGMAWLAEGRFGRDARDIVKAALPAEWLAKLRTKLPG